MSLKELRLSKKMTQRKAADKLSITSDYLSLLERGVKTPSVPLINKMAILYDVTPEYIFLEINRTRCTAS